MKGCVEYGFGTEGNLTMGETGEIMRYHLCEHVYKILNELMGLGGEIVGILSFCFSY